MLNIMTVVLEFQFYKPKNRSVDEESEKFDVEQNSAASNWACLRSKVPSDEINQSKSVLLLWTNREVGALTTKPSFKEAKTPTF